jgi:type IV secretory pathway component VirB8
MKNKIIERYEQTQDNELIINISSKKIEDLYSIYDKKSTFVKKDLDDDFEKYLIESVQEIGNHPFIIRFYFSEQSQENINEKLKNSIKNYFDYLQNLEQRKLKEQVKNSSIFIIIGFIFVAIALILGDNEKFLLKLLSEGSMVAGWVSLWEALATILIKWLPLRNKLKVLNKISNAKIEFC